MNSIAPHNLTAELKQKIQDAYRSWLDARAFKGRRGQREMIADIARTLTQKEPQRIAVIEAGTGTGKTAAYCLAAIPIAQCLEKNVVVTTATVALQEQIVLRDLPDLKLRSGLDFDFALAKGRGRYVCLKRLDDHLKGAGQSDLPMFELPNDADRAVYGELLNAFAEGSWNGELDSYAAGIDADAWSGITTDHRGCSNNRCGFFNQCPFFKARAKLERVDVIVANHDLVLADLGLGGGAVLPEPEETLYVIDEAHHLADKTRNHFTLRTRLRASVSWLDQVNTTLGTLAQRFARPEELVALVQKVSDLSPELANGLGLAITSLEDLEFRVRDENTRIHRFELGRVPELLAETAATLSALATPLVQHLTEVHTLLQEVVDGERVWQQSYEAEDWLGVVGQHQSRAMQFQALYADFETAAEPSEVLRARWVTEMEFDQSEDVELVSAPLVPGALLQDALWSRCFAAVCTSATLTALGSFDRFLENSGIQQPSVLRRIPSPFNYAEIAVFCVPAMESDPRDSDAHSAEIIGLFPQLLAEADSGLFLFSSWRQMRTVLEGLDAATKEPLKIQGSHSKQALLTAHCADIDRGKPSYLVGLASFAEGVDLPDDYCRHVVIVKLPFSVPDDPIDQALSEWTQSKGGNPFFDISLPDAGLRLVQACGRLIRHEEDHGRITLLDKRIVTQRYGQALLAGLPPFRRVLPGSSAPG